MSLIKGKLDGDGDGDRDRNRDRDRTKSIPHKNKPSKGILVFKIPINYDYNPAACCFRHRIK